MDNGISIWLLHPNKKSSTKRNLATTGISIYIIQLWSPCDHKSNSAQNLIAIQMALNHQMSMVSNPRLQVKSHGLIRQLDIFYFILYITCQKYLCKD